MRMMQRVKNIFKKDEVKILFAYLIKYKKWALWGGLAMLINILLLLPTPLITMHLIDNILPGKDFLTLSMFCVLILGILIVKSISSFFQNLNFNKFNEKIIFNIQIDLLGSIQENDTSKSKKHQSGYLLSRLKDDPYYLQGLFASTGLSLIKDIITFFVGLTIVFSLHWKLALVSVFLLPFLIHFIKKYSAKIKKITSKYFEQNAQVTDKMAESISLLSTIKTLGIEKYDTMKLVAELKQNIRLSIDKGILESLYSISVAIITGFGPIIVIWYGMYEIMENRLTLGELIAFNSFLGYLFGPTSRLINLHITIQKSWIAWTRILEFLILDKTFSEESTNQLLLGDIKFEDYSFAYDEKSIVKNINTTLKKNTMIGVVGDSGAGKSTLFNLLKLIGKKYTGNLTINGIEYKNIDRKVLTRQVAVLDQEPVLFRDTIFNNIKLGNRTATDKEIYEAAKLAEIHDFIIGLEDGYKSKLDERGMNLSVGQKQRIALARTILRNPHILILDEPTANIDSRTENEIFKSLNKIMKNKIVIVIAHRLNTVVNSDKIIVLQDGKIVEEGTHNQLINSGLGYYQNLWVKTKSAIPKKDLSLMEHNYA